MQQVAINGFNDLAEHVLQRVLDIGIFFECKNPLSSPYCNTFFLKNFFPKRTNLGICRHAELDIIAAQYALWKPNIKLASPNVSPPRVKYTYNTYVRI